VKAPENIKARLNKAKNIAENEGKTVDSLTGLFYDFLDYLLTFITGSDRMLFMNKMLLLMWRSVAKNEFSAKHTAHCTLHNYTQMSIFYLDTL